MAIDLDSEQQEMIMDFVSESLDMLDTIEPMLIELENTNDHDEVSDTINSVFRLFHTLKGGAGFLNLDRIKTLTHTSENLLQLFRKNPTIFNDKDIEILNRSCDLIRNLLTMVQTNFTEEGFDQDLQTLTQDLERHIQQVSLNMLDSSNQPNSANTAATTAGKQAAAAPTQPTIDLGANVDSNFDLGGYSQASPSDEPDINELLTPEMINTFIQEAEEELEATEGALLVLDTLGSDVDVSEYIEIAFRNIHTLKGNAGFVGVAQIETLSHRAESVLEKLKNKEYADIGNPIQVLLKVVDAVRKGVQQLAGGGRPQLEDFKEVLSQVNGLLDEESAEQIEPPQTSPAMPPQAPAVEAQPAPAEPQPPELSAPLQMASEIDLGPTITDSLQSANPSEETPQALAVPMASAPTSAATHSSNPAPKPAKAEPPVPAKGKAEESGPRAQSPGMAPQRQDIRVSLEKIDQLINLMGELVISEAMVVNNPDLNGLHLERFEKAARQLNKNVRDLQTVSMSMRMVPISSTFRKMIRVVHDVARKTHKEVELEILGEETEVDKTVVEKIADPLLHIIRNAVDHGIDKPTDRIKQGKSKVGHIRLEARHAGSEVWIMVEDDGKGLNRDRILQRAEERGLIEPGAQLADSEIFKLVFEPGFSTAEKVTDVSGRGVGMDVVKRNIEQLRGRVDVHSTKDIGSTFIMRIPLTLAIIEGMLIRVGHALYAIPIMAIRESLQPGDHDITILSNGMEMVKIREELIPVMRIHKLHGIKPDHTRLSRGILVVIEDGDRQITLFVDEVIGQQQIVVKGLPNYLGKVKHLAGCTILGDGGISLILDVASLINNAQF